MTKWDWLEKPLVPPTWDFFFRVLLKAAVLFVVCNLIFAALNPMESLGRLSLYNTLLPGRERLPYGENPSQSYNLSLYNIPAMFASHKLTRPKAADEYRLLLLGDSSTWGYRLENADTLAGQVNKMDLHASDGRRIVAYNLGYPVMSLTKDLMLLDEAMSYQPDRIIWLVTLESFPRDKQFFPPLVRNNADRVSSIMQRSNLYLYLLTAHPALYSDFWSQMWNQTIVGQRRNLADLLRLQLYGFSWAATGIDQYIPPEYTPRQSDFDADVSWYDFTPDHPFIPTDLAFEVLSAGIKRVGSVLLTLVNEPIFISSGQNSDLRYNSWYPRWAYDSYRAILADFIGEQSVNYLDLWDIIDPAQFTDSPVHLTPDASRQLAQQLAALITQ